jgi:hypothetical protein
MDTKYLNGKIYMLYSEIDGEMYVGSTYRSLKDRFVCHNSEVLHPKIKNMNTSVYVHFRDIGGSNMKIRLIEDYPCMDKPSLVWGERKWFDLLKPSLNMVRPVITQRERQDLRNEHTIKWRENNPERYSELCKKYHDIDPEKYKRQQKKWRDKHNIEYNAKRRDKYASNKDHVNARKKAWRAARKAAGLPVI